MADRLSIVTFANSSIARFAAVGAVTTTIDFVLFTTLHAVSLPAAPANTISYSCGIVASYLLNRRWTFAVAGSRAQAAKFVLSTLTGLLISTILVLLFVRFLPAPAAKLASVPIVFVWNYMMARYWVFAGTGQKPVRGHAQCS